MSYRFKVWNSDKVAVNYVAQVGFEKIVLEVATYKEALKLKQKLKKFYLVGRGWNTNNNDKYLNTLCWPE